MDVNSSWVGGDVPLTHLDMKCMQIIDRWFWFWTRRYYILRECETNLKIINVKISLVLMAESREARGCLGPSSTLSYIYGIIYCEIF